MKLSEMSTDKFASTLCAIAPSVARITGDAQCMQSLGKVAKSDMTGLIPLVSSLLDAHRADLYVIVSAMTGKSTDEIASQPARVTVNDVREMLDSDLSDFFKSSVATGNGA